jgi:alanine racemase
MELDVSPHPTWIEIDLAQFRKNLSLIRSHVGGAKICLPVKANAYGHGLVGMARAAVEAGIDCLGVSCLQEGVRLRRAGVSVAILVLGAIHEDQVDDLVRFDLEFSISSKFKADLVARRMKGRCRVHLEVETGMQRTGVRPETAVELFGHLKQLGCFDIVGVYSHLATAERSGDLVALKQIEDFRKLVAGWPGVIAHIANSGGVVHYPESWMGMVRPGLLAYGYGELGVAPCFSLKSRVSYFKVVAGDSGVSYGHTYRTRKQTRIVTVPVGYGDGYRRALSNRGEVLIRGKRFRIAGMICMDQFMVDVGNEEVYVGDEVVLIGKQGDEEIKLMDVATICDTIPYEVLCLFNERIPRFYK